MTLPTQTQLPLDPELIKSENADERYAYQENLVYNLERNYEDVVTRVNGDIESFDPVATDTATSATYTYDHQTGWYLNQGIMVDYWFDVEWTGIASGTPSGNLYIALPYQVLNSDNMPFVGVLQTDTIAYGAGLTTLTINAIPGTFRGEIWGSGTGTSMANVTANTSAARLIGHVRYIRVDDD